MNPSFHRLRSRLLLPALLVALACSSPGEELLSDASVPEDAGTIADAGGDAGPDDAGLLADAGLVADAGEGEDAGALDDAGLADDAGVTEDAGQQVAMVPDFDLVDDNPNSASFDQQVSPRQFAGSISAWYFGHVT